MAPPGASSRQQQKLRALLGEADSPRQYWLGEILRIIQPLPVKATACAQTGAIMLLATGEVFAWRKQGAPPVVVDFGAPDVRVEHIAAGTDHFAALADRFSHNLFTWGGNAFGQLGLGDTTARQQPAVVGAIAERVTGVACGRHFTLAQTEFQSVYAWGNNTRGQLGQLAHSDGGDGGGDNGGDNGGGNGESRVTRARQRDKGTVRQVLQGELPYATSPLLVNALSYASRCKAAEAPGGDPSIGYQRLSLVAQGDQAAAFTSARSDTLRLSGSDELIRLEHLTTEKHSRIADVELRFKLIINRWARRKDGGRALGIGEHETPSACIAAAELIDVRSDRAHREMAELADDSVAEDTTFGGAGGTIGTFSAEDQVVRDPALEELDSRAAITRRERAAMTAALAQLRRDREAALGALSDVETDIANLKRSNSHVRAVASKLAAERAAIAAQLDQLEKYVAAGVVQGIDLDQRESLRRQLAQRDDEKAELGAQVAEFNHNRKALEERGADLRRRLRLLNRDESRMALALHKVQTRFVLYQRLRLRRQRRLQQEYTANLRTLWNLAIRAMHSVWRDLVQPADVFNIIHELGSSSNSTKEQPLQELVRRAVEQSNAGLDAAEAAARAEIDKLMEEYARLEVTRTVVGRAGSPAKAVMAAATAAEVEKLSALTISTPQLIFEKRPGAALLALETAATATTSSTNTNTNTNTNSHSVLVLSKVQFSAVVGDELVVESVSVAVDGCGNGSSGGFSSQELLAVLYEDTDGAPSSMIRDACSRPERITAGAGVTEMTFAFPSPVTIFANSTTRGLASYWLGIFVEQPNGLVRILGARSKTFGRHQGVAKQDGLRPNVSLTRPATSLLVTIAGRQNNRADPPLSVDLIAEKYKSRSPLHPYLQTNVLTTCQRCLRIVQDAIDQRRSVNALLVSVHDVRDIQAFAHKLVKQQQRATAASPLAASPLAASPKLS